MFTNRLSGIKVSENKTGWKFHRILRTSDARTAETWQMDDFLQKLKKMVCIVLYGPAISQSDCRKAVPYQLPCNNVVKLNNLQRDHKYHKPSLDELLPVYIEEGK